MKNYNLYIENNTIILKYEISDFPVKDDWLKNKNTYEKFPLLNTFYLTKELCSKAQADSFYSFKLSTYEKGKYFKIDKSILDLKHDLLIHESAKEYIKLNFFVSKVTHIPKLSIFRKIDELINEQIIIGGTNGNITVGDYLQVIKSLPTSTEISHYLNSRITNSIGDIFDSTKDYESRLEKYKIRYLHFKPTANIDNEYLNNLDIQKFSYLRDKIKKALDTNSEDESYWQSLISQVIKNIFPKYIKVLESVTINDTLKETKRHIDIALLDINGNIDIIEIKKPFDEYSLLRKGLYRDNYIPARELSGSIMQIEKYILHLSRGGIGTEKKLRETCNIPNISVTNPKGMIIAGRSNNFNDEQKRDFEIIKRKYSNLVDIMSYDDLVNRLDNIISYLKT